MRQLLEITSDGDIISDGGEIHPLLVDPLSPYDPEVMEDPAD
jgi:hypothetical protein